MSPERIVILGCSGSGKSTFARAIGARLGLPVVHLDALYWLPNWAECPTPEFRRRVAEAIAGDRWVSEGNYSTKTWDLRLPRADLVVRLRQPRWLCLARVLWRTITQYGRTRADLGPDCPERFDAGTWTLLKFIWTYEKRLPLYDDALKRFGLGDRFVELHGDRAMRAFLRGLDPARRPMPGATAPGPQRGGA